MGINLVIAVTDGDWFDMLRQQPNLDEVNFWAVGRKLPCTPAVRNVSVQAARAAQRDWRWRYLCLCGPPRREGIVKLRRIYPFCGRNPPAPKREINALEVAEQSLNRAKQLNLTIPRTLIGMVIR